MYIVTEIWHCNNQNQDLSLTNQDFYFYSVWDEIPYRGSKQVYFAQGQSEVA